MCLPGLVVSLCLFGEGCGVVFINPGPKIKDRRPSIKGHVERQANMRDISSHSLRFCTLLFY